MKSRTTILFLDSMQIREYYSCQIWPWNSQIRKSKENWYKFSL